MRLDQYVAAATKNVSQKAARDIIRAGRLTVDGLVVTDESFQTLLGIGCSVRLADRDAVGNSVELKEPFHRLLIMNKPSGYVCERPRGCKEWRESRGLQKEAISEADLLERQAHHPHLYELIPVALQHPSLGTFGRLDLDTTGLILLGSDGGLQTLLTHPSSNIQKTYIAQLDPAHRLSATAADEFAAGICLSDGTKCEVARLDVLETADGDDETKGCATLVRVTLHEGKYHQVKRMLGAAGACVAALHRESIGDGAINVKGMAVGDVRAATLEQMLAVKELLPSTLELRCNEKRKGVPGTASAKSRGSRGRKEVCDAATRASSRRPIGLAFSESRASGAVVVAQTTPQGAQSTRGRGGAAHAATLMRT